MRDITATLKAAAQSWSAVPSVSLMIHDPRVRYSMLHESLNTANKYTDQLANNGVIIRIRSDASGKIAFSRVTDPTVSTQWVIWDELATGALANSDVAIAHFSGNMLRAYWLVAGIDVQVAHSEDNGVTWDTEQTVVAGLTGTPRIAACDDIVCILDTQLKITQCSIWHGSWTAPGAAGGWTFTDSQGVAICYDTLEDDYPIMLAADGVLVTTRAWYVVTTLNFADLSWVSPGGEQTAPADSAPADPSCAVVEDIFVATWRFKNVGAPLSWDQPFTCTSNDWIHFGNFLPLNLTATTRRRAAVCYSAYDDVLYIANETNVISATYDPLLVGSSMPQVVKYQRKTYPDAPATLHVECIDTDNTWRLNPDSTGAAALLLPLSRVILSRGYVTAIGAEVINLDPYYLIDAHRTERESGGRLQLTLTDGWGLLDLWHPQEPIVWTGHSIVWLLAELCARVGLNWDTDGDAAFLRTVPAWSISPQQSARDSIKDLLRYAGAAATWTVDGRLYAFAWPRTIGAPPDIGDANEIIKGLYGIATYPYTSVSVSGDAIGSLACNAQDAMALGLNLPETLQDYRIVTQAIADETRDRMLAFATRHGRADSIVIPVRPELELWDVVDIIDDAIPLASKARTIVQLSEAYDSTSQVCRSDLTLIDA